MEPVIKPRGLKRLFKAFGYSLEGLNAAWLTEEAFRIEVICFFILLPLSFYLHVTTGQRAAMIASLFVVLIAEIINSAIEATIDRIGTEIHPLSKKAKDCGSAAVLLALLNAGLVWGIILLS